MSDAASSSERTYFFDTYAILELINGNQNYQKYTECNKLLSIFNIIELHYNLMKVVPEEKAREIVLPFCKNIINFSMKEILDANKFRFDNKKKRLSFTDCIGYILAKNKDVMFLTGDKEFEKIEKVEFVR